MLRPLDLGGVQMESIKLSSPAIGGQRFVRMRVMEQHGCSDPEVLKARKSDYIVEPSRIR
jgi:hypothetical protein